MDGRRLDEVGGRVAMSIFLKMYSVTLFAIKTGERATRALDRDLNREGSSDDDEEQGEEEEGEEEEREAEAASSRGAAAVRAALEALSHARERLGAAEGHVKAYSRSFQFDVIEHQRLGDRLKAVSERAGRGIGSSRIIKEFSPREMSNLCAFLMCVCLLLSGGKADKGPRISKLSSTSGCDERGIRQIKGFL